MKPLHARWLLGALALVSALSVTGVFAQESTTGAVAAASLPAATRLTGLTPIWQQINRCSGAALTMQLSYFDEFGGTYDDVIRYLNPHLDDVAVRLDEMAAYAGTIGLRAVERTGGTVGLLKALVAGGFPVLVENSYFDGADGLND